MAEYQDFFLKKIRSLLPYLINSTRMILFYLKSTVMIVQLRHQIDNQVSLLYMIKIHFLQIISFKNPDIRKIWNYLS